MTIWMSILLKGLSSSNQHSFSKSHGAKIGSLVLSNHIGHSEFGLINHNRIWILNWCWLRLVGFFFFRWFLTRTWFSQCREGYFFLSFWCQDIYSVTWKINLNISKNYWIITWSVFDHFESSDLKPSMFRMPTLLPSLLLLLFSSILQPFFSLLLPSLPSSLFVFVALFEHHWIILLVHLLYPSFEQTLKLNLLILESLELF